MKILIEKRQIIFILMLISISFLSGTILFTNAGKTAFHGDESGWISSGYYYTDLLIRGDFHGQDWEKKELGPFGDLNPHLGKWLIGFPLTLRSPAQNFSHLYDFERNAQENEQAGNIPPKHILLYARFVSSVFGVLCCLLIFTICYMAFNAWVGVFSIILLLGNQLFVRFATRAMTDIYYNFFLLCLPLWGLLYLQHRSVKRTVFLSSLLGIFSGLACSVKIAGLVLGGLFFLALLVNRFILNLQKKEALLSLAAFCLSSIAVVYILNPWLWPDFGKVRGGEIVQELVSFSGDLASVTPSRLLSEKAMSEIYGERYPQLSNLSHVLRFPYLFMRWNSFMDRQASAPGEKWEGNRVKTLHETFYSLFVSYRTLFFLEGILFCVGAMMCASKVYSSLRNNEYTLWSVPLFYFSVNYLFIVIFMKLNWDRYYLPAIVASKLIVAIGIYQVGTFFFDKIEVAFSSLLHRKVP